MFQISSTLRVLSLPSNANVGQQAVRFIRKPKKPTWLPTAKSKRFRVPQDPNVPADESREIRRLFANYYTTHKSLTAYLTSKYSLKNQEEFDHEKHRQEVEEDFVRCKSLNDEWNTQQAVVREDRVARELEADIEQALRDVEAHQQADGKRLENMEHIVLAEIESSKQFINYENLDEAIEKALQNTTDHNYSLDSDGGRTVGRETDPPVENVPVRRRTIKN